MKNETEDKKIHLKDTPVFTMNTTDKLFFALARRDNETLSYVYALVINDLNAGKHAAPSYSMDMRTEISVFKNAIHADIYYETAKLVMEQQKTGGQKRLIETFRDVFETQISAFNKMAANFKTRQK